MSFLWRYGETLVEGRAMQTRVVAERLAAKWNMVFLMGRSISVRSYNVLPLKFAEYESLGTVSSIAEVPDRGSTMIVRITLFHGCWSRPFEDSLCSSEHRIRLFWLKDLVQEDVHISAFWWNLILVLGYIKIRCMYLLPYRKFVRCDVSLRTLLKASFKRYLSLVRGVNALWSSWRCWTASVHSTNAPESLRPRYSGNKALVRRSC